MREELRDIPTARDPWVVIQTIPGIQIDRVNVGGSESGQQSIFSSKGTVGGSFQVDGVNMGDGGSNAYYDFDSFQEMQVITGGGDASIRGSNAHLNMITKRGTNTLHGSARIFVVDHHFQSNNLPSEAVGQGLTDGNHIDAIQDYGAELGGPLWSDRLWLWGSYGRDQIDLVVPGGGLDNTTLDDFNAKLNAQIVPSNSAEIWYLRGDKVKLGRNGGLSHPQPTTWDQTTPQNTWKVQDSQVVSSSLFASLLYAGENGGFTLTPEGGLSTQAFLDSGGVWHNTYAFYSAKLAQRQVKADASYFLNTGKLGHELKLGFNYLTLGNSSATAWPGDGSGGLAAQTYGDAGYFCSVPCAVITRSGFLGTDGKFWSAFLSDTITADRLTVNLGLRWDEQYATTRPSTVPANPTFPEILPAFVYRGGGKDFIFKDWQPRVAIAYSLPSKRSTVLKASYSRYAETLNTSFAALPTNFGAAYAYYAWNDANGDHLVQPNEVDTSPAGFLSSRGYNPANPGSPDAPFNAIDHRLRAPRTDEFLVGVEHELLPALAVGLHYTHRKFLGELYFPFNVFDAGSGHLLTGSDYEQYATLTGTTPDGVSYSQPVYRIKESVLENLGLCVNDPSGGLDCQAPAGIFLSNRRSFRTTYDGLELVLTKRLAGRWMARGSFVYNDNRQTLNVSQACIDPTNQLSFFSTGNAQPCRDGLVAAFGGKGAVFLNSKWQFSFVGLYQLPWGFAVAASVYGRQGYPINWYRQAPDNATDGLTREVFVTPVGASRYRDLFEVDLRVEKTIRVGSGTTVTLSADLFNAPNQGTVLQRQNRITVLADGSTIDPSSNTNQIREIQSPRIWRFGARIAF